MLSGAKIGANCNINCQVFAENDDLLSDGCVIEPGTYDELREYGGSHFREMMEM